MDVKIREIPKTAHKQKSAKKGEISTRTLIKKSPRIVYEGNQAFESIVL